jgi:sugar lactone lactonase YvrE
LPNAIYRADPDGSVVQLSTDIYRPNGIEVSPDGRRLYVSASNLPARLVRNPLGPAFQHDDPQDRPPEVFGGTNTIHTGGDTPSFLLLPEIS